MQGRQSQKEVYFTIYINLKLGNYKLMKMMHPKTLEKQEQTLFSKSRWGEIIKMKAETNEERKIKHRRTMKKGVFFKKTNKLTNFSQIQQKERKDTSE